MDEFKWMSGERELDEIIGDLDRRKMIKEREKLFRIAVFAISKLNLPRNIENFDEPGLVKLKDIPYLVQSCTEEASEVFCKNRTEKNNVEALYLFYFLLKIISDEVKLIEENMGDEEKIKSSLYKLNKCLVYFKKMRGNEGIK